MSDGRTERYRKRSNIHTFLLIQFYTHTHTDSRFCSHQSSCIYCAAHSKLVPTTSFVATTTIFATCTHMMTPKPKQKQNRSFFCCWYTHGEEKSLFSFLFSHFFLSNSQCSRIDSELVSMKHFFGLAQQHLNTYFQKLNCKETDSLWCVRRFLHASSDNFLFSNRPTEYEQTNKRTNE